MMELAKRTQKVSPSATLAITSKAKKLKSQGNDIINFAAGEPDFDTPDFIKNSAIEAIKSGFTKYTPSTGTPDLKKAISDKFRKENQIDYPPEQIAVSCGAKHSIFNTLLALVNSGEEVIIPTPYWVSYPQMTRICQANPCLVETKFENNFKITPAELKNNLSAKSKVLILNTPSNPCGSVYSKEELERIAEVCVLNKIHVLSDEIYEKLIFDGLKHTSIASLNKDICQLTVTVNGVSKTFSMTGWRIGYLGASAEIIKGISKLQDHSTSCPNSIAQKAALAALTAKGDFVNSMRKEFQKRRDYIIGRLDKMKKITYLKPQGAFYIFCDISKTGLNSLQFAERLLEEKLIALIPGVGFGRDDYLRISFATSLSQIEKGMDRLEEWEKQL